MSVFELIVDVLFKMTWLNNLAGWITQSILRLDLQSSLGSSVQFFLYDVAKIFILLTILIYSISYVQSYFPPERTQKLLGKGIKGRIIGALLGTVTPFCSCSSIPLFIGFTASGLPIGTTFAFLISSPLVDLASFLMLASFFGIEIALLYVLVGVMLAVVGGTIIDWLKLEDQVQDYVRDIHVGQADVATMTRKQRHQFSLEQVQSIVKKVWLFIIIGVLIGSVIHNYVPEKLVVSLLGNGNPLGVPLATIIGAPMYADIFGILPIAQALFNKGAQLGTLLAFMMAVTALSLPSMIMLSKVVKKKLLIIFIVIVTVGIIIIGYGFNFVAPFIL